MLCDEILPRGGIRRQVLMPAFTIQTDCHSEYRRLAWARPAGPVIGVFGGQLVSSAVVDKSGHRYVYAGVISWNRHSRYGAELLGPGEWIVEPGIVYREDNLGTSTSSIIPQNPVLKVWTDLVERLKQSGKANKQKPEMRVHISMSNSDWSFILGFWTCVAISTWLIFMLGLQ